MQFEYASHVKKLRGGGGFIIHCFVSPDAFIAPPGVQRRKGKKLTLKN